MSYYFSPQKTGKAMMAAGKGAIFETWSLLNQDLVQAAAHSYGERIVSIHFSHNFIGI